MKSSKPLFLKSKPLARKKLPEIYRALRKSFGHQRWWPGETPFEIMVGAILTQNTSWTNVEKAIQNLKQADKLTPKAIQAIPVDELAELIRPSGYFNIKAKRLKFFITYLFEKYAGDLKRMARQKGTNLRKELLEVNGIGPETADSILLYALQKPFFVIDAYTKRIFSRHGLISQKDLLQFTYDDWQQLFTAALPAKLSLYNDFHAQIVMLAKSFCRSREALCTACPLAIYL